MDFKESQHDMVNAYFGGATGVLASGLVWAVAGIVGISMSEQASMAALFIGGMFIFPLSIVFSKLLKRSGQHAPSNALKHLAFEGLSILFVGLFLAFTISKIQSNLFYPVMLLTIGARYLTFQTLYGLKTYWFLGALLIIAGAVTILFNQPFIVGAFIGAVIEIVCSIVLFYKCRTNK